MDVRFMGVEAALEELEPTLERYFAEGRTRKVTHQIEATINTGQPGVPVKTDRQLEAISAVSVDKVDVAVLRRDRISVSKVQGYTCWEDLWTEFERLFDSYVQVAHPVGIRNVAARFINRIQPAAQMSFEDVLERPPLPVLGEGLAGARISNFLRRHVVEGLPNAYTANLTVATAVPEPSENLQLSVPLVLDIDVFKPCEMPVDLAQLRPMFDEIRAIKNAIFFGSLTDRCLEQFE